MGEAPPRTRASRSQSAQARTSRSLEQEVARQRAGHLPTLDLSRKLHALDDPPTRSPGVIGPVTNAAPSGITLSVPIFSGGLIQSRVREALALATNAEQDLENTRRTVAQAVRTNYLNVTAGIALVRALEQALTSTQSQLDSTILGRDVGVRTSVDVLNAQQQVFQTRRDLQRRATTYLLNTLRLKAAVGHARPRPTSRRSTARSGAPDSAPLRGGLLDPVHQALHRAAMRGDERAGASRPSRARSASRLSARRRAQRLAAHRRTRTAAPAAIAPSAASSKLYVCGPTITGVPSAHGSIRFWPPNGSRLPPMITTSAAA